MIKKKYVLHEITNTRPLPEKFSKLHLYLEVQSKCSPTSLPLPQQKKIIAMCTLKLTKFTARITKRR